MYKTLLAENFGGLVPKICLAEKKNMADSVFIYIEGNQG